MRRMGRGDRAGASGGYDRAPNEVEARVAARMHRKTIVKETNCNHILNAAKAALAKRAYWEIRLEDVAADAGMSKASLYQYYPNKEALFLSLAAREESALLCIIEAQMTDSRPALENLRAVIGSIVNFYADYTPNSLSVSGMRSGVDGLDRPPDLMKIHHAFQSRMIALFQRLVADGKRTGVLSSRLAPDELAILLHALVSNACVLLCKRSGVVDIEAETGVIMEFFLNGVGARTRKRAGNGKNNGTI